MSDEELIKRLRSVMPEESTIDLDQHARNIAGSLKGLKTLDAYLLEYIREAQKRLKERSDGN